MSREQHESEIAAVGAASNTVLRWPRRSLNWIWDWCPCCQFSPKLPSEEFRTLRTRLEQLQATRSIQAVLVASPSPGEGKSFTAANLALAEAQLADNPTLLCDFDLRSPVLQRIFQIDRSPGISDYLLGPGRASRGHAKNRR